MRNRLIFAINLFQVDFVSVKHGITEVGDPISCIDIVAVGFKFEVKGQVAMAENKIIYMLFFQHVPAVHDNFFLIIPQVSSSLDLPVSF